MHLYHGTGVYCLASIVASNVLEEGCHWGKLDEPHGPRLTKSYDKAVEFIAYNMHWGEGGIVVFDRNKLAAQHILEEYADTFYSGESMPDEQEVAVITPLIENVDQYLVGVICEPGVIEEYASRELMDIAMSEGGWPYSCDDAGVQSALADLRTLAGSSLLNQWLPAGYGYPLLANQKFDVVQDAG